MGAESRRVSPTVWGINVPFLMKTTLGNQRYAERGGGGRPDFFFR